MRILKEKAKKEAALEKSDEEMENEMKLDKYLNIVHGSYINENDFKDGKEGY